MRTIYREKFMKNIKICVLSAMMLLLAACGQRETKQAELFSQEESVSEKDKVLKNISSAELYTDAEGGEKKEKVYVKDAKEQDEVLKTMEMTVRDTNYTIEAVGKNKENGCGIREIHVYKEDKLLQTIWLKEAIDKDGVDGIDTGYTQCFEKEESFALKDVNFDGYEDLEVCGWLPNNNIPYYYWCFHPDTEQFKYAFCLQLTRIDEENKLLVSECREQWGVYSISSYHVNEENQLELVETITEAVKE